MSQKNVEIVRRWIELFNRRDTKGLKELTEPDFEMRSLLLAVESDFRGDVDFPGAYFEALDDAYQRFQSVPEDFTDAGTAVLVSTRLHWRGKGSGAHGETPIFAAFWLRAGKVFKEETFTDRTEALEAVGLSKQDADADSP
jgi:ketosteroid isomerase-like protein